MSSDYTQEQKIVFSSLMMVFQHGITYQTPDFADYFCHTLLRLDQLSDIELDHLFNRFRSRVKEGEVEEILEIYERQVEARQARENNNINIRFPEPNEQIDKRKKKSWFKRLFGR